MSRNFTPTSILDAKGAFIRHPERSRPNEPQSDRPLGSPPKGMSDEEKKIWKQLAKECLPGVVKQSDRTAFTLLVKLATKLYNNEEMRVGEMAVMISLCSRFALTPADRSKVAIEQPKESALQEFLTRKTA